MHLCYLKSIKRCNKVIIDTSSQTYKITCYAIVIVSPSTHFNNRKYNFVRVEFYTSTLLYFASCLVFTFSYYSIGRGYVIQPKDFSINKKYFTSVQNLGALK